MKPIEILKLLWSGSPQRQVNIGTMLTAMVSREARKKNENDADLGPRVEDLERRLNGLGPVLAGYILIDSPYHIRRSITDGRDIREHRAPGFEREHMDRRVMKTNKRVAAERQIHAAIAHFRTGDFECAITLCSAAEGQMPEPADPTHLFAILKQYGDAHPSPDGRKDDWNYLAIWMKHGSRRGRN